MPTLVHCLTHAIVLWCRLCLGFNAWLEWWSIWSNCLPSSKLSRAPPDSCHSVVMPSNRVLILSKSTVQQGWGHGTQVAFLPDTFCLLCGRWIGPKVLVKSIDTVQSGYGFCLPSCLTWHGVRVKFLPPVWEVNWLNWKEWCELTSFYLPCWYKLPLSV